MIYTKQFLCPPIYVLSLSVSPFLPCKFSRGVVEMIIMIMFSVSVVYSKLLLLCVFSHEIIYNYIILFLRLLVHLSTLFYNHNCLIQSLKLCTRGDFVLLVGLRPPLDMLKLIHRVDMVE
jgi:hypothetical protein